MIDRLAIEMVMNDTPFDSQIDKINEEKWHDRGLSWTIETNYRTTKSFAHLTA